MSTKHLKRIAGFCVLVCLFTYLCLIAIRLTPPTIQPQTQTPTPRSPAPHFSWSTPEFDTHAYYRPILEYNLFRPLSWTPPRPQEPYRLLGTIIPIDAKSPPKAIIQNTVGNQTHIVTIGDNLDTETHVTDIQTKHITLKKNGQQRQLTLKSSFLRRQ